MRLSPRQIAQLSKKSVIAWSDDRASSMGAALAYYTAFSLSPLLLIVIAVAGLVLDPGTTQQAIIRQFEGLLGSDGAKLIQTLIESAQNKDSGIISIAISAVTLFIGATTVFAELENDLNEIWRVDRSEAIAATGMWHFVRTRILSFGIVLALGFLLMVSSFRLAPSP
jgi:membrane protein